MSTNAYWLDEKTQLTINKKSVAYGEEIPEDMLRKIDPKSLEIFQKNGQIGSSMPKPGRLPGQAEYMRQIETLEKTVKSQSKQAAQAAGLVQAGGAGSDRENVRIHDPSEHFGQQ